MEKRRTMIACTALVWLLVMAPPARAYLDPSTGGMLVSSLVGLLASLGLALKTYWYRVRALLRRRDRRVQDRELVDGDVGARH
jgi:hypothetical protein